MPDQTTITPQPGQQPTGGALPAAPGVQGTSGQDLTPEQRRANREDRRERIRREQAEAELTTLKSKLAELEQSKLSEVEKREKDAYAKGQKEAKDALLSEIRAKETRWEIEKRLVKAGVVDPDAVRMMEIKDLDPADAKAMDEAVEEFLAAKPYLVQQGQAQVVGQSGFPNRGGQSTVQGKIWKQSEIQSLIRTNLTEYKQKQQEINAAIREGRVDMSS